MGDKTRSNESSMYNNNITITPAECDLYAGSFFRPSRPSRGTGDPIQNAPPDLFSGTDPYKQFIRFEQSVFKLDRLLSMRNFNKLNSMPDRETVDSTASMEPSSISSKLPEQDIEDWLGNVVSADSSKRAVQVDQYKEKRKAELMATKISDVMKKAMLIEPKLARKIEKQAQDAFKFQEAESEPIADTEEPASSTSTKVVQNWKDVIKTIDTSLRPIPIFDHDSLCLLSPIQLGYLLESFGITKHLSKKPSHMSLVRAWLMLTVKKLEQLLGSGIRVLEDGLPVKLVCVLSNTRKLEDLVRIIQNREKNLGILQEEVEVVVEDQKSDSTTEVSSAGSGMNSKSEASSSAARFDWTPELDSELLSYVEAFLRRRDQATTAFELWKEEYGPALPERFANVKSPSVWGLVARELTRISGANVSKIACKKRFIAINRSSL